MGTVRVYNIIICLCTLMYGEFNDEMENEMDLDCGRNDEEYIEKLRECDGGWEIGRVLIAPRWRII